MMSDITCPKCGDEQEVVHDDGYGYEEDTLHYQFCSTCGYKIQFTTSITYTYESYCSDGHDLEAFSDRFPDMYQCKNCDHFQRGKEQE